MSEFEKTIFHNWAHYFACPDETVTRPGTTLRPEPKFGEDRLALVCSVGRHTFIRITPVLMDLIGDAVGRFGANESVSAGMLASTLGADLVQSRDRTLNYYLEQHHLPDYLPTAPFSIRKLTLADAEALDALKATCTPAEVDEGFVEVDHQLAFGCFDGRIMAAAASGYERTGFMDIGVLTNSNYRRKGLGKAVAGAVCQWSFENGYIPQYRHDVNNASSAHVAKSLNFKVYAEEEALWIK